MPQPTFKGGLSYEGKVTLTLKSDGQILESRTYKNHGTPKLFEFLCDCLADDFHRARDLMPSKIMLLYNSSAAPHNSLEIAQNVKQRSSYQGLSQQPTVITDNDGKISVIYSFEVPKAAITSEFNQVALYRTDAKYTDAGIKDFSAYYFLTDGTGSFSPQSTQEWRPSTILLIEWELTISNKDE